MQQHIEAFGRDLRRERRYSACSTIGYLRDVRRVLARIGQQLGRPVEPADLTLATLRTWQASCAQDAAATVSRQISAVRALCAFLHGEGLLPEDPAVKIRRPRIPRTLPLMLDQGQVRALVEAPRRGAYADPRLDRVLRLRDRAILEVAYGSGLRVAELAALRLDCLAIRTRTAGRRDVTELAIRVLAGKGGKQRTVVCRGAAVRAVQAYLRRRPELAPTTDHLWVGAQGRPLVIPGLRGVVRRWGRAVGLRAYPHALRHAFCSHVLERGAKLIYVQQQMGHANLATTSLYVSTSGRDVGDEVAAYHPRA